MTCSVRSPALRNHRIMSIAISQKHIFIFIFHYSVSRILSPKFSLALSAANDDTLSKFKSHYSSMLFLFPSILFLFVFLDWKTTVLNYIVKKAIRNVSPFPWFQAQTKLHAFNQICDFPTKSQVMLAILTVFVLARHITVTIGEVWQTISHAVIMRSFTYLN